MVTQALWAINSYQHNKMEIKTSVNDAMAVAAKKTNDHSACFQTFSKAYIKKGEGFYLSKFTAGDKRDTVPMFFSGKGLFYKESGKKILEKYNNFYFGSPVTAEVIINFRYQLSDSNFSRISQDSIFNRLSPTNYQEILSGNININKLYDTKFMDSTLHSELSRRSVDMPYSLGIIESGSNAIVYRNDSIPDSTFLKSEYRNDLNEEGYFNKHYRLAIVFSGNFIVGKNLWLMLLISAFVVLLLITLMWQFIRVITRQRKINEMKNDFINNMTHEFNTPIANISLAAESLTKSEDLQKDEKSARLVSIIQEQNESIRGNVEHILKIASNERKVMQLNKERLNVSDLVKSVIYEFKFIISEKGGTINFTEPVPALFIQADELYILHVMQNIIDNAIKYNHNQPLITVSAFTKDHFAVIAIEDNGIGMTKDEVKYIFDKFYRVPTGNIHHTKGFGLGLNYVQSIIRAHEGFVKVKTNPEKGSRFELYIPVITKDN